jgi:signal transduction histidine kinase
MQNSRSRSGFFLEHLVPIAVLSILLAYVYAFFFKVPYVGFFYNPSSDQITSVYVSADPGAALQKGDTILKVGSITREMFLADANQPFFERLRKGEIEEITVIRDGHETVIQWVFPGLNQEELLARLLNNWWLAFIFWIFGLAIQVFMRPHDGRWRLMVLANYLTSLWLIFGNLSAWQIWMSSVLLHGVTWLMLPVYLNLHWDFPKPLGKLPKAFWIAMYAVAALCAIGQITQLLPRSFYMLGFLLMLLGSLSLLIFHYAKQTDQRREVGFLIIALVIALAPSISLGIVGQLGNLPRAGPFALLALPLMPGAYFFVIYRRQLGGLELRANRVIAFFIYGAIFLTIAFPISLAISAFSADKSTAVTLSLAFTLLASIITALFFPSFQRWIEARLLGMPLPMARVLEQYAARIITSMDMEQLKRILCDEILPSFQIRQAALFQLKSETNLVPLFTVGVSTEQFPLPADVPVLLSAGRQTRTVTTDPVDVTICPWARLILRLTYEGELTGFCLLGQRDPDDYYAAAELPTLQALMDQTALALKNIEQADHLRALYMADIERQEIGQNRLALELHDEVLGQMALLAISVADSVLSPAFEKAYQSATDRIRQIVAGLQPTMLNYGLQPALDELADSIMDLGTGIRVELEIPAATIRYSVTTELHIFRIAQQACQNVLQHARARNLLIKGKLEQAQGELVVEDDGVGFAAEAPIDLLGLLANRHFGLAGMYERAALIGATMTVESSPGHGTRVRVTWRSEQLKAEQPQLMPA